MRYLRMTAFASMEDAPSTMFVAESDLNVSLEVAEHQQRTSAMKLGLFTVSEILESDKGLEELVMEWTDSEGPEVDKNMAVLFFWTLDVVMPMVRPGGVIAPDPNGANYPAPFDGGRATYVLEQMARSPKCKGDVSVLVDCEDGSKLKLHRGKVTAR